MSGPYKPRLDKRARATGRLGVTRGERYALLPAEVLESDAFRALPHFAVRVLLILAAQFHGHNNGAVGLTASQALGYGIKAWELYAGLRLLEAVGLLVRTRQGHVARGTKLPNWFALTWRGMNEAPEGQFYDAGIGPCSLASNAWARWTKPGDWDAFVRDVKQKHRGKTGAERKKKPVPPQAGDSSTLQAGAEEALIAPHRRVA